MKMGLTGSPACIKYLLFIFNLIFLITGIVILSVGAVIQAVYHNYSDFLDDGFYSVPALLVAVGTIVIVISFFGCCGAVKENHCMVITFSVLLGVVFVLELSAGIAGYALSDRTEAVLTASLEETIQQYNSTNPNEMTIIWDNMQTDFSCCGANNASDWAAVVNSTELLPVSCCATQHGAVGSTNCTVHSENLHHDGCVDKLGDFVREYAVTIGAVCIALAFIQLLGVAFSCFLGRAIRQSYESV